MSVNLKLAKKLFKHDAARDVVDTVRSRESGFRRADTALMDAFAAWESLSEFRRKAARNEMYTFKDQWGDRVPGRNGGQTERDHIRSQGNVPLTNNRIRGIVRSVVGLFLSSQTEPVCVARARDKQEQAAIMSSTVQYVYQANKLWSLDANDLNYLLISGLACYKSIYGWRRGKMDVWVDTVQPGSFFFDPHMVDPRHWDCHLVGQIHDLGLYDVLAKFSDGSPEKAEKLKELYRYTNKQRTVNYISNLMGRQTRDLEFFVPQDDTRCRVIEVWTKESKERLLVHDKLTGDFYKLDIKDEEKLQAENARRKAEQSAEGVAPEDMKLISYKWTIDNYWYFRYLTPTGEVLKEGETPFWHGEHPYSFRVYPFYNGQVFPFVGDFIDQQRYINRLIMMQDFIMRASAKGVLMIPEDAIPEGTTPEDIAEEWVKFNGVIVYTAKPGQAPPQQVTSNSQNLGVYDMLSIQLKMLEDVSGVQGVLQGQQPNSGTPSSLYMQQAQNASTSLSELLDSFRTLREERDAKLVKLIQQFYTEPRYVDNESSSKSGGVMYDPKEVRNMEFDLSIVESANTPAYRVVMDNFLMQVFQTGQITLKELLENSSLPFADKLLQSVSARGADMQQVAGGQGQAPVGGLPGSPQSMVPPDIQQQITQNTQQGVKDMLSQQRQMQQG